MEFATEMIQLGLLKKEAYEEFISNSISKHEIDANKCGTVTALIKSWHKEKNVGCTDRSLEKFYDEILHSLLFPHLATIIAKVETETTINFQHFKSVESCLGSEGSIVTSTVSSRPSKVIPKNGNRCTKFDIDVEQKVVEVNEMILIPKLIKLIVTIREYLSSSENKLNPECMGISEDCNNLTARRIDSSIGDIFDHLKLHLHECSESVTKCDHQRVKFLSLVFTSFVLGNDWLYTDSVGLQKSIKSVITVALQMIQSSHDAEITATLLNLILHPFLETFPKENQSTIDKLWDIVHGFFSEVDGFIFEDTNSTGFLILCFMSDFMFRNNTLNMMKNLDKFYLIVQYGLMHWDALTRKRSQFMLKRTIEFYGSSEDSHPSSIYFMWSNKDKIILERLWHDFFLLLETLEEKQSHVVWPVLNKIDQFIEKTALKLSHISWLLVIIKRIFDHDNKSIKYWGVMKFLRLKLREMILTSSFVAFINTHLLTVLNDYSLYSQENGQCVDGAISSIGDEFGNFLLNFVECADSSVLNYFMHSILRSIFDGRSWGSISLFYVIRGLSVLPSIRLWSYENVKGVLVKFEGCLSTQEVIVRSASQCALLRAVLKHLDTSTTLIELCSIIQHFRRKESWCRGTVLWGILVEGVVSFVEASSGSYALKNALDLFFKSTEKKNAFASPQIASLAVCLILESSSVNCDVDRKDEVQALLQPVNIFLSECHLRPYLDQQKYVWVLKFLCQVLEIYNDIPTNSKNVNNVTESYILWMECSIDCILQLFQIHVAGFDNLDNLEIMLVYLDLFSQLCQADSLSHIVEKHFCDLLGLCKRLLTGSSSLKVSFGVFLLEFLLCYYFDQAGMSTKQEIAEVTISGVLQNVEEITGRRKNDCYLSAKSYAKFQMEVTRSCWSCVELLVKKTTSWTNEGGEIKQLRAEIESSCTSLLTESITSAGRVNVLSIFKTCVELTDIIIKENMWSSVIEQLWKSSSEFKKCELYRSLIKCLADMLFHHEAILQEDCSDTITKISNSLLDSAECVQGIACHLARSLICSISELKYDAGTPFISKTVIDLILILATFGAVFRKQQRIITETVAYIQRCPEMYSTNLFLDTVESDQQARVVVLRYLLSLDKNRQQDEVLSGELFRNLKHHYASCAGDKRDFANSQKHRYKTRMLQVFMVILPLLNEVNCCDALEWLCRGLIKDHQQPSVRYMQEWGISLIVIYHPSLFPKFFEFFTQGTKERIGCVGSFLASLTHIACTTEDASELNLSIQYTLPWCMAQHFNTRLYAQVSLRKIWQHCVNKNVTEVLNRYCAVQQCLQFVSEQGNAVRNTLNMLNDFYFKVFHPIQHYTLETIFYDLPYLSLLSNDEWLTVESLVNVIDVQTLPINSSLPIRNRDQVLAKSLPAPWVVKAAGEVSPEDQNDGESNKSIVQKKMTPWRSMMPELEYSLELPNQKSSRQQRGSLVVVASLIDKAPNLGGLCRTCEVFSVKEYVVPSLAIQEDHNFNSLSLTAQQWVPMKEVKPESLREYLKSLQSEGYTLIAAEQTASSKSLSEFEFPERSVVVLGNEREGIPCDLLQLLDVCVEIPQTGIIRSLNVHVSGALFVWEYTRQYRKKYSNAKYS